MFWPCFFFMIILKHENDRKYHAEHEQWVSDQKPLGHFHYFYVSRQHDSYIPYAACTLTLKKWLHSFESDEIPWRLFVSIFEKAKLPLQQTVGISVNGKAKQTRKFLPVVVRIIASVFFFSFTLCFPTNVTLIHN